MSAHTRAIVLIVLGLAAAASAGALMKYLAQSLPILLIVWFRFMGYFLILLPVVAWRSGAQVVRVPRPGLQLVRGLAMASATLLFVTGARTLEFATAISVLYSYPFLLTLSAPFFLGERVSLAAWMGVVGGFIGVLLVVRPEIEMDTGVFWVLACAVLVAAQLIMNRKLGAVADPMLTSFYGAAIAMLVLSAAVPLVWQPVGAEHVVPLVLLAFAGAAGQTCIILAFAKVPASDLAPFTYSELVSAVIIGFVLFGTVPDGIAFAGIALIVASGIAVARAMAMRNTPRRVTKI